ncbi:hypothetical protein PV328_004353, partial [Microctonus aethiopoides]
MTINDYSFHHYLYHRKRSPRSPDPEKDGSGSGGGGSGSSGSSASGSSGSGGSGSSGSGSGSSTYNELIVMDDIGEFVMYQNVARSSAIVYFEKLEAIFGIHGKDYYIQGHPLKLDMEYHDPVIVKSPHLVKIEFTPFPVDPIFVPHNLPMNKDEGSYGNDQNKEQMMNTQAGPSTRPDSIQENTDGMSDKEDGAKRYEAHNDKEQRQRSGIYYIETLVFISKDVTEIYYNAFKDDYINEIVRYYLIYFNAVDLFFRQLKFHGINIHINIAKIVIED